MLLFIKNYKKQNLFLIIILCIINYLIAIQIINLKSNNFNYNFDSNLYYNSSNSYSLLKDEDNVSQTLNIGELLKVYLPDLQLKKANRFTQNQVATSIKKGNNISNIFYSTNSFKSIIDYNIEISSLNIKFLTHGKYPQNNQVILPEHFALTLNENPEKLINTDFKIDDKVYKISGIYIPISLEQSMIIIGDDSLSSPLINKKTSEYDENYFTKKITDKIVIALLISLLLTFSIYIIFIYKQIYHFLKMYKYNKLSKYSLTSLVVVPLFIYIVFLIIIFS